MEWKCSNCPSTKAFADFSEAEPTLRCLECHWEDALDENQCTAPTSGAWQGREGKRCSQHAVTAGRCWRHIKNDVIHKELYRYFRDYREYDLPQIHRVIFDEALKNARVVIADERHGEQLHQRAAELRVKPERGPSVVYFVEREGLIKIGVSANLDKRLSDIGKGSSMLPGMTIGPVTLLATESGDRTLEQSLHQRFRKTRVAGEWFRPSKALHSYIDDLKRFQNNPGHFLRRVTAA